MEKQINSIEKAIEIIIDSASKHSLASEIGDYRLANKNFDLIRKAVHYLRENNRVDRLEELLDYEDINVRLAVASYFLAHNRAKAISVLENIISLEIPHKSFEAELVLEEFKKGNITL